jgi:hypothetical protein
MNETIDKILINKHKKETQKQTIVFIVFNLFILLIAMGFSLWWQNKFTIKSIADGIWLVFSIQLTMSWSFFVYNRNIFTPLLHGGKTFFLLFVGRKPKEDYYAAYTKVLENPVPNFVILTSLFFTIAVFLIAIFVNIVVYQGVL